MADPVFRLDENVAGSWYVDDTCIACDTCVGIAPRHFVLTPDDRHAYVWAQPVSTTDVAQCQQAMGACPVGAIGHD